MIRNLLFDLGGVIMDIERKRCVEAFTALGMPDADSFFGDAKQQGPFLALESGQIDKDEFHAIIRQLIPGQPSDEQIDAALCRFLIGIPRHRLEALRRLHGKYRIYMLSNTNPIMWDRFILKEFKQEGGDIDTYFDGIVTSFDAKVCKPDQAIFDFAITQLGIDPAETLFLDDAMVNIEAGRRAGFQAELVTPERGFQQILES